MPERQVESDSVIGEPGLVQAPCLVVLTGEAARNSTRISALLDAGALIVIGPSADAVRAWLPRALLSGEGPELPHVVVRVSHLEVDLTEQRARWLDKRLDVSAQELRLLAALATESGRVWTFEELMERVWGARSYGDRSAIHSAVKRLRKKLARTRTDIRIESIRGTGFYLAEDAAHVREGGRSWDGPEGHLCSDGGYLATNAQELPTFCP